MLINAIFSSPEDATLIEILSDANNGAQVVGKILAVSNLSASEKERMVEVTRKVLPNIKASSTPPYRMLLEAVGLPVPAGHLGAGGFGRRSFGPQQSFGYGGYGYPGGSPPMGHSGSSSSQMAYGSMGQALSPLMGAQNMSLGPSHHGLVGSPSTPIARHRGRLSPGTQMMSPASDPFNPFASPSIDMPYMQRQGVHMAPSGPLTFEPRPDAGGLGMGLPQNGGQVYYQPNAVSYFLLRMGPLQGNGWIRREQR